MNPEQLSNLPTVGSGITLYEQKKYKQIPLATDSVYGIVKAGNGLLASPAGTFQTSGLLHGVPGAGRELGSSDNLNSTSLDSGEYDVPSNAAKPSNCPSGVSGAGRVRISNYGNCILQQFFPRYISSVPSTDPNAVSWWRIWYTGDGWGPWSKAGGANGTDVTYKGGTHSTGNYSLTSLWTYDLPANAVLTGLGSHRNSGHGVISFRYHYLQVDPS